MKPSHTHCLVAALDDDVVPTAVLVLCAVRGRQPEVNCWTDGGGGDDAKYVKRRKMMYDEAVNVLLHVGRVEKKLKNRREKIAFIILFFSVLFS